MNKIIVCLCLLLPWQLVANQTIDVALDETISRGCLSNRRTAGQIEEWGVPDRLFQESCFTNLVSIMNRELANCDFQYVNGLTGIVKRAVFVAALTKCGVASYHDSVVRWFGQPSVPSSANVDVLDSFVSPIATDFEDYMPMNFDSPGISNVLTNAKQLYHADGDSIKETAMERILSGKSKVSKLYYLSNGLIDRIRDGSSR